ncbi:hypothetical protein [Agrobacterium vitis]|uniref:hypothetical protein n=1 Tax=Agrobacterium vitis TaxID=373 RepID=UPI001F28CE6D|nr:hypothetical protein [Agrobacterium vitis]WEO73208.1 hypothetical protein G6L01_007775 [Agrobacterium vitis]
MREQILLVADVYGAQRGISRKRVSTLVLNRGSKLDDIAGGCDILTAIFERAMEWFSANWPEGAHWPDEVVRPGIRIPEVVE